MWHHFVNLRNKKRLPGSGTHTGPFVMALALMYCIAGAAPALADEPYRLDEVVVTASRIETPLAEAPANVTVITAEQIREMGAQTLVDVFQREPGVFTQNVFGNPKTANVDIRGYGEAAPQNVLFLSTAGASTPSTCPAPTSRRYPWTPSRGSRSTGARRASFSATTPPRAP